MLGRMLIVFLVWFGSVFCGCDTPTTNNNDNNINNQDTYPSCNVSTCRPIILGLVTLNGLNFSLKLSKTYQVKILSGVCDRSSSQIKMDEDNRKAPYVFEEWSPDCSRFFWAYVVVHSQQKKIEIHFSSDNPKILGEKKVLLMQLQMFEDGIKIVDSGEIELSNFAESYPNGVGCEPTCYTWFHQCLSPQRLCRILIGNEIRIKCVDLQTDTTHCGECGYSCKARESCVKGVCR